jgi:hypothetical protein
MRLRSAVALIAASFHLFSSLVGLSLFHFQKKECPYAVAEGGKAVYSVRLLFQPSHNITLTFGLIDPYVRVLTPQLHFTASNWSVPQELFVEGVDDDIIRVSPYPAVISLASQSDNSTYNTHRDGGLPAANLTLLVSETDKAGVFINEKGTYVLAPDIPEGRSRIFLIQLRSIPQSVVTVNLTALNETITIDPTVMVFRPSDWNVTQELTVYTIDDDIRMDSPYKAGVGITMTSGDMDYNGADVEDLVVTIEDNDEGIGSIVLQASLTWKRDISISRTTAVFYLQVTFTIQDSLVVTPGQKIQLPLTLDFGDGQLKDMAVSIQVYLYYQ